jgi:hypothetical protein
MPWREVHTKVIDALSTAISLTRKQWAVVDNDDLQRVLAHRWSCADNGHGAFYAYVNIKVVTSKAGDTKQIAYMLQRFILGLGVRGDRADVVIFKDGNSLNCRKENLVQCIRRRRVAA